MLKYRVELLQEPPETATNRRDLGHQANMSSIMLLTKNCTASKHEQNMPEITQRNALQCKYAYGDPCVPP